MTTSNQSKHPEGDGPCRGDLKLVGDTSVGKAAGADPLAPPAAGRESIKNFLIPQDFTALSPPRRVDTATVGKPTKYDYVRVRPNVGVRVLLADVGGGEYFLVDPQLATKLEGESTISWRYLVEARKRSGGLLLWALPFPSDGIFGGAWVESALEAARLAQSAWVRLQWDRDAKTYRINIASALIPDPVWPDASIEELVEKALGRRVIDSMDHPALRALRGEV